MIGIVKYEVNTDKKEHPALDKSGIVDKQCNDEIRLSLRGLPFSMYAKFSGF